MHAALRRGMVGVALLASACFTPDGGAADDGTGSTATSGGPSTSSGTAGTTDPMCAPSEGGAFVCSALGAFCDGDDRIDCTTDAEGCLVAARTVCEASTCVQGACVVAGCGDGVVQVDEACDDGNAEGGDGCSGQCQPETGWTCDDASPTSCVAPNLAVRIVSAVPTADTLTVTYVVRNLGEAPAPVFRVDVWDTRPEGFGTPPPPGMAGPVLRTDHPPLDAGATAMYVQTFDNPPNGSHVAFAIVDTLDEIHETDEVDNCSLGFAWTTSVDVVHTSFPSASLPLTIADDATVTAATVEIEAMHPVEIFASVNVTHPALEQLSLRLVGPNGAARVLAAGLTGANLAGTTFGTALDFDDLADGSAPYRGGFVPDEAWDDTPTVSGTFTLEVVDAVPGQTGVINALTITVVGD